MRRKRLPRYSKRGLFEADSRELFARSCLHFVGNDEAYGKPYILDEWERRYIWRPVFAAGKVDANGNFVRKHSSALVMLPRGVGKTAIAVAMLLSEATMRVVMNGEYGLVADSKDNVRKAFKYLTAMVRLSPELSKGWRIYTNLIENIETGQRIMIFPNDENALQSWHFNFAICDEVHTYKDDGVWNAVVSGQAHVPDAFALAITTASKERKGFLWEWYSEDIEDDDTCWLYCVGIDDDDDADEERSWEKIIMELYPRVTIDELRSQKKKLRPRRFEQYQLNRFPLIKSETAVFSRRQIDACRSISAPFDFSQPFNVGVDGAISGDSFAIVAHQRLDDGIDRWHEWVYDTPGESGYYDLDQIEGIIRDIYARYRCPIGADPARLTLMLQHLQDADVEVMDVKQTNLIMCPACDMVARSVKGRTCALSETPKLAEHLENCVEVDRDPFGYRFGSVRHGQGSPRIDAAIAAAIAKYMTEMIPREPSFAETGGIWSV